VPAPTTPVQIHLFCWDSVCVYVCAHTSQKIKGLIINKPIFTTGYIRTLIQEKLDKEFWTKITENFIRYMLETIELLVLF
jgi:putative AlgH/UPF0301 family transcriptional regulator